MSTVLKISAAAVLALTIFVLWSSDGSLRHLKAIAEGVELDWRELATPGALTESHAFIGDDCRACHTAFTGVERQKCVTCHVAEEALLGRQPTAFHADVGDCSGCHVEHEGDVAISQMNHDLLWHLGSYASQEAGGASKITFEAKTAIANLLDTETKQSELACAACHGNEDVHFDYFSDDCSDCHGQLTWDVPGFRHPSPASSECAQCHQAPPSHYMGHFKMVSQTVARKPHSPVEACQDCHETNAWNDIVGIGFYKHH